MEKFTPQGKAAIETILRCMQEAHAAFNNLSAVENKACYDFHNEGASLNHCIRWGLSAAEEIHAAIQPGVNTKTWSVKLLMEDQTEYQWSGEADDTDHAEGLAIAEANAKTRQQVYEIVSVTSPDTERASV
ncbi:hypothetical protein RQP54_18070 [Curvibacter sp. APW13]|uniref:hypothetical protein n=1 Tax=Curvibacter sp. APW13 TaxID=3077236 RepID=UPI0028DDDD95|nr:hypothetical protein [Curvibacter sp. APW13]MDT8992785.1 hypothetical protein [Curvibacter sp. APW13]